MVQEITYIFKIMQKCDTIFHVIVMQIEGGMFLSYWPLHDFHAAYIDCICSVYYIQIGAYITYRNNARKQKTRQNQVRNKH